MHSTLYRQLKIYVDDILEKDGYYKKIYIHNWKINISLFVLFIFASALIILLTRVFLDIINNILLIKVTKSDICFTNEGKKINKLIIFISFIIIFISFIIILAYVFSKYLKKSHFNKINVDKYAMKNEIISKMKSDHRLKKTLDEAFKNTDDKNVLKNILVNEAKINNDKKSPQIIVNLIYYFVTSLIAIILTVINDNYIKINLISIAIALIICVCLFSFFYIDQIRFSDELLETYIKDYIMNYWLQIHYCGSSS